MNAPASNLPQAIPLSLIRESKLNPRHRFRGIDELAESLKVQQLYPVLLRPHPEEPGCYELADGARRFRAAHRATLDVLMAHVKDLTDEQMLEIILGAGSEGNVETLTALEEAEGYALAMKLLGLDIEDVAPRFGRSPAHVQRRLALLDLPPIAKKAMESGELPATTAWLIARIPGEQIRAAAAKAVLHSDLHGGVMPFRVAAKYIEQNISKPLRDAPFAVDDATLVPEAGACAKRDTHVKTWCGVCPFHAGADLETYGDIGNPHTCMHPACYEKKVQAARARVLAAEATKGKVALPEDINEQVFPQDEKGVSWKSDYVSLTQPISRDLLKPEVSKAPAWRELIGQGHKIEVATQKRDESGELRTVREKVDAPTVTVYVGFDQDGRAVDLVKLSEAMVAVPPDEAAIFKDDVRRRYTVAEAAAPVEPPAAKKKTSPKPASAPSKPEAARVAAEEPSEAESWGDRAGRWIASALEAVPTLPPGMREAGFQLLREAGISTLTQHTVEQASASSEPTQEDEMEWLRHSVNKAFDDAGLQTDRSRDRVVKLATGGKTFGELTQPEQLRRVLEFLSNAASRGGSPAPAAAEAE